MRHQYYADAYDVEKWSGILRLARNVGSVYWVACLCPDQPDGHGAQRHTPPGAEPEVLAFFAKERARLAAGEPKELARTALLFGSMGIGFDMNLEPYPNQDYFNAVVRFLRQRPANRRDVVFLDPDTGIAPKLVRPQHVRLEHAKQVFDALRPGDVFCVIQWPARGKERMRKRELQDTLGVRIEQDGKLLFANQTTNH